MKKFILAIFSLGIGLISMYSTLAMGSGDKYSDFQTGVTFQILKPTETLGLPMLNFEVRPCRLYPKKEEYLLVGYGSQDRGISLVETSNIFNCTGKDKPQSLGNVDVNGIKAKIGIYCTAKCAKADFKNQGGEITFTVPKGKYLDSTYVRVGTQGGFTLKQLLKFARGLEIVGLN